MLVRLYVRCDDNCLSNAFVYFLNNPLRYIQNCKHSLNSKQLKCCNVMVQNEMLWTDVLFGHAYEKNEKPFPVLDQ